MLPSKRILTELIGRVYETVGDVALWESFLAGLAQRTHAESAALVIHERKPELHTLAASWRLDPECSRLYQEYYGSVDVWAMRGRLKPPGYVCASESLCTSRELACTEIYNDFLVHQGAVHGMFGFLENDPSGRWGTVSLYRGLPGNEFHTSDLETLTFLMPHIRQAFKLHFQFSELKAHCEGIERAVNLLTTGVVFVGAKGEIVLTNSAAEELLRRNDGLLFVHGRLRTTFDAEANSLQAVISGATQTSNGKGLSAGGTILVSRRRGRPLSVTVAPLRNVNVGLGQRPAAVLFISDPVQNVELPADLLRRCYRLTSAEARLTMFLVEGHSLKETADLSGITHNTAKSQLKNIFVKTSVQRQAQLVRLVLSSPPLRKSV
jgi:DNA-binding CsgD family transcriptional regulator